MTDRGTRRGLTRALRVSALIVLPFGVLWAGIGLALGAPSLAAQGAIGAIVAVWLLLEIRLGAAGPEGRLAIRIAAPAAMR